MEKSRFTEDQMVKILREAEANSGLVHTAIATPANTGDVTQAEALLHGEEEAAFGDAGYQGANKRPESTMKN